MRHRNVQFLFVSTSEAESPVEARRIPLRMELPFDVYETVIHEIAEWTTGAYAQPIRDRIVIHMPSIPPNAKIARGGDWVFEDGTHMTPYDFFGKFGGAFEDVPKRP